MSERIWDAFLTEQDRQSLRERPRMVWGFGERPALLLIDLYRGVFGDSPEPLLEAMKTWPESCGLAAWEALPHIRNLLDTARIAQIPIVHVTGFEENTGVLNWTEAGRLRSSGLYTSPDMRDKLQRKYQIIDELAPIDGEALIRKIAPSAFWGTPLAGHLTALRIDTLIVCGESTSGCVRATVVDARSHRFKVIVPEECVFDRHQAPHAINLFDMHQKYADVLPVAEVITHLQGLRTR